MTIRNSNLADWLKSYFDAIYTKSFRHNLTSLCKKCKKKICDRMLYLWATSADEECSTRIEHVTIRKSNFAVWKAISKLFIPEEIIQTQFNKLMQMVPKKICDRLLCLWAASADEECSTRSELSTWPFETRNLVTEKSFRCCLYRTEYFKHNLTSVCRRKQQEDLRSNALPLSY